MTGVSTTAVQRLRRDAARLAKDPVPYVTAAPLPSNILEWHYVVQGPPDTPYEGGVYHGKLIFPPEYPFRPPSIYMLTPNGRFQVNTRLCLSISDFHPDTWNPAWSVSTILTGLLSFMLETTSTFGSMVTSDYEKRALARSSLLYNLKSKTFRDLFPQFCENRDSTDAVSNSQNGDPTCVKRSQANKNGQVGEREEEAIDGQGNIGGVPARRGGVLTGPALSNLVIFAGVVAFVFVARYVLQSVE